eukprot:1178082-Prorocentrum_minimum.AAC.1
MVLRVEAPREVGCVISCGGSEVWASVRMLRVGVSSHQKRWVVSPSPRGNSPAHLLVRLGARRAVANVQPPRLVVRAVGRGRDLCPPVPPKTQG